jgi:hypothetical protein
MMAALLARSVLFGSCFGKTLCRYSLRWNVMVRFKRPKESLTFAKPHASEGTGLVVVVENAPAHMQSRGGPRAR